MRSLRKKPVQLDGTMRVRWYLLKRHVVQHADTYSSTIRVYGWFYRISRVFGLSIYMAPKKGPFKTQHRIRSDSDENIKSSLYFTVRVRSSFTFSVSEPRRPGKVGPIGPKKRFLVGCSLPFMRLARLTPQGASLWGQARSAWSVKTRRAPSPGIAGMRESMSHDYGHA